MRYKVEIETRDCGDSCPGHFDASVIRGPSWTRETFGLSRERIVAYEEVVAAIRARHRFHSFDFIHTPA